MSLLLFMIIFFASSDVNYMMFGVSASQKQLKICIIFWYITFASGLSVRCPLVKKENEKKDDDDE